MKKAAQKLSGFFYAVYRTNINFSHIYSLITDKTEFLSYKSNGLIFVICEYLYL
jgi:hypothetical protein